MKKIMILNGAGKKNGTTAAIVKAFTEAASSAGNEVKEFYLQNMSIHGCLDCGGCRRKAKDSAEPCVQQDSMNEVYSAYRDSDVIVFASPVYWWDISGTLKTAIDRLYAALNNFTTDVPKETVLLMTSGGSSIDHMADWYRNFEYWLGWKNLGTVMNDIEKARVIGASIS